MKKFLKTTVLSVCTGLLFILDVTVSPEFLLPVEVTMVPEAHAIFGTRRRTAVIAYSAGKASAANSQAAAAPAAAPAPAPAAAPAPAPAPAAPAASGAPLPLGSVVSSIPAGCASTPISGVEYYHCGGNYYRATFQGNNLVYVTAKP